MHSYFKKIVFISTHLIQYYNYYVHQLLNMDSKCHIKVQSVDYCSYSGLLNNPGADTYVHGQIDRSIHTHKMSSQIKALKHARNKT